jgi:hypothetical protein
MGDRPLGLEVGQLLAAAKWYCAQGSGQSHVRLEAAGLRSQVVALVAAALEPKLFSEVNVTGGMQSLGFLLDAAVPFRSAPELFCLDLYKDFDINNFKAMAAPTKVSEKDFAKPGALPTAAADDN